MKLTNILLEGNQDKVEATASGFNRVIDSVDDSMGYDVFAKAVAKILKDEYGEQNYKPFINILHGQLGILEQEDPNKLQSLQNELEQALPKYKLYVTSNRVEFIERLDIPEDDFEKAKQIITSKGYKIGIADRTHEVDLDDDRDFFPRIQFS